MTTVHSSGSYTEPIVVSDEEDAAFVENELSRWTDSSNSSSNTPTYNPYTSYFTPVDTPASPTLPKAAPAPAPVPAPPPAPSSIEAPVYGQKRKWTDMRESSSIQTLHQPENHGGSKKKKKQKKERQAQQRAAASSSHKPQRNVPALPPMDAVNHMDYAGSPFTQNPFDAYYYSYGMGYTAPMEAYQSAGASFLPPEDEYRPTDGPLWNPSERPSTLSALATPWYPPNGSYTPYESHAEPSSASRPEARSATPPPDPPPPQSSMPTQTPVAEPVSPSSSNAPPSLDLASMLQQPFDSSLSERLKQLEAISASLLALANGQRTSEQAASASSVNPIHLPPSDPPPIRREPLPPPRNVPEVAPSRPQGESQKRLIGMPEDKGNNGYFDLTVPNLEPPSSAAPIPPVADFTLVMAHLPKKFRKTDFVMSWAKRHGTPVRVVIDTKNGKALVEWVGAHSVESAFTSMRLRGDGKEHIRVYHYRGDKPPPAPPPQSHGAAKVEKEIEEGEIEEGEVVEAGGKSKKKRNKGKKKAMELEQRLSEPTVPSAVPPPPAPASPTQARQLPPHFSSLGDIDLAAVLSAVSRVPGIVTPAPSASRPQLIDRFTDPPAVIPTREEAEEEEMELESDADDEKPPQPSPVPPPITAAPSTESSDYQEEDMDLDDDDDEGVGAGDADVEEDEGDMDMDMSSPSPSPTSEPLPALADPPAPAPTHIPSPSPPQPTSDLPHHEAIVEVVPPLPAPASPKPDEGVIAAAKDARRHRLEEAIARTKAELAMRALATSSRTSLVSSTGSSESPEPMTPVDSPVVGHVEVAFASSAPHHAVDVIARKQSVAEEKTGVVVKTEAVALDDLAASFISDTIHAAAASPPVPTPLPKSSSTVRTAPAPATTGRLSVSIPAPKTTAPVMIPLSEEQKQIKQKKWLELVTGSKSLFAKIAAAKTKEEKDLLMRLLRAKTKAADELKREIDSGVVLIASTATASSSSVSPVSSVSATTASATPTPVPSSRMSSATPTPAGTPAPTGLSTVPQKRKTSPPSGAPTPSLAFRWPETPREMIIIVSDDEESDYDY